MALIAPSLLAGDFAYLGEALRVIEEAGARMVHLDVMDGHFVPDITAGQPVVRSLRRATRLALDVHLLIERPERYAAEFIEAGADRVAVHVESTPHLHRVLEQIRARNAKAGVALNPATPVESVAEVLGEIDFLSVLSADPGIEEQAFIARSTAKVQAAARARDERGLGLAIQVEGGIGFDHIDELMRVGADILVVGSAIFDNDDPKAKLKEMIRLACAGRQTTPRSVGKELSPVSRGAAEDL